MTKGWESAGQIKKGFITSEFAATAATIAGAMLMPLAETIARLPFWWASILAAGIAAAGYSNSRGKVKAAALTAHGYASETPTVPQ